MQKKIEFTYYEQPVTEKVGYTLIFAFSLFFIELSLFWLSPSMGWGIFIHLLLVSLSLGCVFIFYKQGWEARFPIIFTVFFSTMGPIGAAFSLAVILFYLLFAHTSPSTAELLESLYPEVVLEKRDILYERLLYGMEDVTKEGGAIAFQDIMTFGSEKQKRSAIEKMLKYFHPAFFPALFLGLSDPSNSIRVHAATAITNLDEHFFEYYLHLKTISEQRPSDEKILLALAEHCTMYASSRILDAEREKKVREEAIAAYLAYVKLTSADAKTSLALAKLYLAAHQPRLAKKWLEPVIYKPDLSPDYYLAWMNVLFENGDYNALRAFSSSIPLETLDHQSIHFNKLKQFAEVWSHSKQMEARQVWQ